MRHKKTIRKLGVTTKHRKALFRNMVTDLFRYGAIKTTDKKAKEIRRIAEKMITLAKQGTLSSRRRAASYIRDKSIVKKLFDELAELYKDRPGGYTRIIKLGFRRGDNTPISLIELVKEEYTPKKSKKVKKESKETVEDIRKESSSEITKEGSGTEVQEKSSKKEGAKELGLTENETRDSEKESVEPKEDSSNSPSQEDSSKN